MDSTLERIKAIQAQLNEIEKRMTDDSLTTEQKTELDGEWEMLDAELAMYDDIMFQYQLAEQAELDIVGEDDCINPSDEDVARWDLERQRTSGWGYEGDGTFNLADEA